MFRVLGYNSSACGVKVILVPIVFESYCGGAFRCKAAAQSKNNDAIYTFEMRYEAFYTLK